MSHAVLWVGIILFVSLLQVLQKHDAARVLQSCFRMGSAAQKDLLLAEVKGQGVALSLSHYGHAHRIRALVLEPRIERQQLGTASCSSQALLRAVRAAARRRRAQATAACGGARHIRKVHQSR